MKNNYFINKIKRVVEFLPVIWKGSDYDYIYAINLFEYQLKRTADYLDSDEALSLDSKIQARKIRTVLNLMDKVYNEKYLYEYMDTIERLYGEECTSIVPIEGTPIRYGLKVTHANAKDEEHEKEILEHKNLLSKLAYEKHEKAHRLLWKLIEHRIRRWWD